MLLRLLQLATHVMHMGLAASQSMERALNERLWLLRDSTTGATTPDCAVEGPDRPSWCAKQFGRDCLKADRPPSG